MLQFVNVVIFINIMIVAYFYFISIDIFNINIYFFAEYIMKQILSKFNSSFHEKIDDCAIIIYIKLNTSKYLYTLTISTNLEIYLDKIIIF